MLADMPGLCAPAPVKAVELLGDVPDDGDTVGSVGVAIARTEVLLSLTSTLVDDIVALDLVWPDAVMLGL